MVAHLAFAVLGLHRVGSYSNPDNVRSTRALLGVGFRHEGVLRDWHRHGGRHHDVNVFGLLRAEWEAGPLAGVPVRVEGDAPRGVPARRRRGRLLGSRRPAADPCRARRAGLPRPPRPTAKPRDERRHARIDTGLSTAEAAGLMASAGRLRRPRAPRLGLGLRDRATCARKIDVYRDRGVPVMLGGTLTELAWLQGAVDGLRDWLDELEIEHVEVSSGDGRDPAGREAAADRRWRATATVFAEVGEKDPNALHRALPLGRADPRGARRPARTQVVCEGRATGDAGMYRPDGEPRTGLIDEIVHEIDPDRLIFEAPQQHQQVWFIEHFGPDVNLGNVPPARRDLARDAPPRPARRHAELFHGDDGVILARPPRRDRRQRAAGARQGWSTRR